MGRRSSFSLSEIQVCELEDLRKDAQRVGAADVDRRARALLLVGRDGKSRRQAAEICEVNERTVYRCQRYFENDGVEALWTAERPGRPSRLAEEQLKILSKTIEAGPAAAGLETGIWTGPIIAKYVAQKFGVQYSASQIRRILHRLGFSVQYPKKRLSKADLAKQEHWLTEVYPVLQERAEAEDSTIFLRTKQSSSNPGAAPKRGHRWVKGRPSTANQ